MQLLSNLKIGARLGAAFAIPLAMMATVAVVGFTSLKAADGYMDDIVHDNVVKMRLVNDMSEQVHIVSRVLRTVVLLNEDAAIAAEQRKIEDARAKYDKAWEALGKMPASDAGMAIRAKIDAARRDARGVNDRVMTLARAFVQLGYRSVRFNFRGVGASAGHWDTGRGEVDDALAVIAAERSAGLPLVLGGFSFGGYVASQAAARLAALGEAQRASRLVLIAPAAGNFQVAPVPADTLVVHGEADDVVPLSAVLDWARPQSLPITLVPGSGHFFHGQLTLLKRIVLTAFA